MCWYEYCVGWSGIIWCLFMWWDVPMVMMWCVSVWDVRPGVGRPTRMSDKLADGDDEIFGTTTLSSTYCMMRGCSIFFRSTINKLNLLYPHRRSQLHKYYTLIRNTSWPLPESSIDFIIFCDHYFSPSASSNFVIIHPPYPRLFIHHRNPQFVTVHTTINMST